MSDPNQPGDPADAKRFQIPKPNLVALVMESFGLSRAIAGVLVGICALLLLGAIAYFIYSAPPTTLTITAGPEGSVFYTNAWKYSTNLLGQGVRMKILASNGSEENLKRLANNAKGVDVGFVLTGITNGETDDLVSLGSVGHQPLLVFYRGAMFDMLSGLAGRRLAIGPKGSGTRTLTTTLLAANGVTNDAATTLLDWDAAQSSAGLLAGTVDAVFLMGEDASPAIMRKLLLAPEIHLMNFAQAEAYTRKFPYLTVIKLPQGGIDLGKNIPATDVNLIGPSVELIARKNLHPALSDLLLTAARHVNGNATLLQRQGEFPAAEPHDLPISADAARFYKSGKGFFYGMFPFWVASLISRILVAFVPTVIVIIPILRSIPQLYRWRSQSRIYRWYRELLGLEKEIFKEPAVARRKHLHRRLDEIEREVNRMKVPAFLADQFYNLRGHIAVVREMLKAAPEK